MNSYSPDILYWIWLSLALGPCCKNSNEILDATACNATAIYQADEERLGDFEVFKKSQITRLLNKDLKKAEDILSYCRENSISILSPRCPQYPKMLARIPSCPIILYLLGTMPDFAGRISVGMVGTRQMTKTGQRSAYEISYDLAKSGVIITSGMALGIDGVCHTAAIDSGGTTIAVLGCGIDVVYPSQHKELIKQILASNGAVITEFAPGTRPFAGNFPMRNRIISGLSVGTVVVEAGLKSGALNTANHAFEQGKDVFAVPGPTGESSNEGSNALLKNGALAITCAEDIIDHYTSRYGNKISFRHIMKMKQSRATKPTTQVPAKFAKKEKKKSEESERDPLPTKISQEVKKETAAGDDKTKAILATLDELSQRVYLSVTETTKFPDQIAVELGISISEILMVITILEVKGILARLPGGQYKAK